MDNEATKILNPQQKSEPKSEQITTPSNTKKKEETVFQAKDNNVSNFGAKVAATAAGAALGTSAAMAAEHIYDTYVEERPQEEELAQDAPTEQETIVMTDEGLQVAQVDDSLSFSEAFAEARAQVGAGGVFEWHGKVYGTFYENEWNNMSAAEKAEWQAKVDYNDVTESEDAQTASTHQPVTAQAVPSSHSLQEAEAIPEDGTYVDPATPEPMATANGDEDDEIHVVGVAIQENGQGGMSTLAQLQSGNDSILVVDVESDGRLDYVFHDDNGNGQIDQGEVHDISGDGISTEHVIGSYVEEAHAHAVVPVITDLDSGEDYQIVETEEGYSMADMDDNTPDSNTYTAYNDDMPDYMNDADAGFMDA